MNDRRIGQLAWVMAWVGLVVGQFHAMARHQTVDGKEDLEVWTTRVWSDPARDLFRPLLDWASPDAVYLTYGKIWFPVFAAFTACAFVLYRRRRPAGFEKFAWRFALIAYTWGCVAVLVTYWTQWTHETAVLDLAFVFLDIPGLLLSMIGSTMLGITLIRPRIPATGDRLAAGAEPAAVHRHRDVHLDGQRRPPRDVRLRHRRPPARPLQRHRGGHRPRRAPVATCSLGLTQPGGSEGRQVSPVSRGFRHLSAVASADKHQFPRSAGETDDPTHTTDSGSSCWPVGPIWMSVPISGQTPQS